MGREPLIFALLLALGCAEDEGELPWFDGPTGAAVLDPEEGGPFDEPVGFVANARSGTIVPIDVKHVTLLTDQPGAPFLMPRQIATGDERRLDQVAVIANDEEDVTLFASDLAFEVLVEAPYLEGRGEDFPERVEPTATDATFVDADGSGDTPVLGGITLRVGYTTTEDWTVEHDGSRWWVFGSRSGKQTTEPRQGEEYCSDRRELCFTLTGEATEGDRFELSTDAGVVEHDLGGPILGLAKAPGQDLLLASVWSEQAGAGEIVFFDPVAGAVLGRVSPGEGAQPGHFAFDAESGLAYAADTRLPAVYELALSDLGATLTTIETAAPVSAVAVAQTSGGPRLFAGLNELLRVDVYDLTAGTWVDVNPLDDEVAGVPIRAPIVGLDATPEPIKLQQETAWGASLEAPAVVLTTALGEILLLDAETGCLATEDEGPTLEVGSNGEAEFTFSDVGTSSDPAMLIDDATGWPVVVNPCGGIARSETWTVIYDQTRAAWRVEGTRSGEQESLAYEETRYVSDHGEVSFTLLNGAAPATSGDAFAFSVDDGALRIQGRETSDGSVLPYDLPAPPVVFQAEVGRTGGGWDKLDRRTYALVPVTGSDEVLRVLLSAWAVQVVWD